MKGPTSPFEIPLIVDLISRDLSKKDIVNCILVNSDFHTQFKGHHWHEVKISADKQRYRNKGFSLEYQKAVLENGHLIRKLSIRGELFRNHLKLDWNVAWEVDADEEDDHDNGDNEGYLEGEEDEKDEDKDTGNDDEKPPSNDFEWQEKYSHLKSVDMVVKLSGCEDTTLFPFLQRCPALEEVKIVQASYSIFKETFSIESTTITSGLIAWRDIQDENDGPNWACLELEDLEIRFLDVRNRNYGQNEEMNTIAGINRAYKQIGRLSRLQRLRLGWHPNQPTSHQAKLDMSITSGLRQMEGLKELRELDITYINEVNIGQDEVEFMVESWPKLRRIKGLLELNLSKFPAEDENIVTSNTELGECPACIQWLLQQKQFISIT
ncbi:hypothetical protein BGZ80_002268 [Entomortierella chlamydospora]|uniref:Uncharacterized protein n=1 Tax=Entomortierella chlamydospora TaxID=101097 RepID=A0A9P6MQK3_9FUNG|nr:hypothetical protein BGZ80_002268 [Entomortierella chlamydospora]